MRGAISKQKECCFSLTHFLECDEERESGLGRTHKTLLSQDLLQEFNTLQLYTTSEPHHLCDDH
jgi:hypothetical protein